MAQTWKRFSAKDVTSETSIVTCPSEKVYAIAGINVANTDTDAASVNIKIGDVFIVKDFTLNVGSSLSLSGSDNKLVMVENDELKALSDKKVDIYVSILEI